MTVKELRSVYETRTSNAQRLAIIAGKHIAAMNEPTQSIRAYTISQWQAAGLSKAAAQRVHAALSLDLRPNIGAKITQSEEVHSALMEHFPEGLSHEKFLICALNRANKIVGVETVSVGGTSGTVVDAKIVFSHALRYHASSVILAHNHPSGSMKPSAADLRITKKLVNAGTSLDIAVLDHLIFTDKGYVSLADNGYM